MTCMILGDSIAVGVGQARPECQTIAKVGITSGAYLARAAAHVDAETVVISLGVNDGDTGGTLANLRAVRGRIQADTVYWLLPGLREPARTAIRTVAAERGDLVIDTRPEAGRDHLHPNADGYRAIAAMTCRHPGTIAEGARP